MEITKEQKEAIEFIKDLIAWDVRQDLCPNKEECENLEILLNLIEKLQKENEELEEINNELEAEKNEAIRRYNFETISIKKVKDKIEELNQYYKKEIYPNLYQWRDITITEHYDEMIELLQEIIGDK